MSGKYLEVSYAYHTKIIISNCQGMHTKYIVLFSFPYTYITENIFGKTFSIITDFVAILSNFVSSISSKMKVITIIESGNAKFKEKLTCD